MIAKSFVEKTKEKHQSGNMRIKTAICLANITGKNVGRSRFITKMLIKYLYAVKMRRTGTLLSHMHAHTTTHRNTHTLVIASIHDTLFSGRRKEKKNTTLVIL